MRRVEREALEPLGFDGCEEGVQGNRLGRRGGRRGQTVELEAQRAVLFRGVSRRQFDIEVHGRGRIATRDVEMRQILAGRHEQGERQQ